MEKINKIKESIEMYRRRFLTLDTEVAKDLLKQYEFESNALGLNTKKIIALKQVIMFRCCPKCGEKLRYQETGGCMADGNFEEWIECVSCDYSRDLTNNDIEIIYGDY